MKIEHKIERNGLSKTTTIEFDELNDDVAKVLEMVGIVIQRVDMSKSVMTRDEALAAFSKSESKKGRFEGKRPTKLIEKLLGISGVIEVKVDETRDTGMIMISIKGNPKKEDVAEAIYRSISLTIKTVGDIEVEFNGFSYFYSELKG